MCVAIRTYNFTFSYLFFYLFERILLIHGSDIRNLCSPNVVEFHHVEGIDNITILTWYICLVRLYKLSFLVPSVSLKLHRPLLVFFIVSTLCLLSFYFVFIWHIYIIPNQLCASCRIRTYVDRTAAWFTVRCNCPLYQQRITKSSIEESNSRLADPNRTRCRNAYRWCVLNC